MGESGFFRCTELFFIGNFFIWERYGRGIGVLRMKRVGWGRRKWSLEGIGDFYGDRVWRDFGI